jgi:hypothetical protein
LKSALSLRNALIAVLKFFFDPMTPWTKTIDFGVVADPINSNAKDFE